MFFFILNANSLPFLKFQSDSVSYFMNEIDRIEKIDYVPTPKDILYCRKATKGVHEFTIRIEVCIVDRLII